MPRPIGIPGNSSDAVRDESDHRFGVDAGHLFKLQFMHSAQRPPVGRNCCFSNLPVVNQKPRWLAADLKLLDVFLSRYQRSLDCFRR